MDTVKEQFENLKSKVSTIRTPAEFFNAKRISKPNNFIDLQSRITYNLSYYSSNYITIIGLLSIYTLLTNLLLLFVLAIVIGGMTFINRLNGESLVLPFGSFTTNQLYTYLLCVTIPLGFLASPISSMLWLIGASCFTIFTHAALLEKPIETVFEEETV